MVNHGILRVQENASNYVGYYKSLNESDKVIFPIINKDTIRKDYSNFLTCNMDEHMRESILDQLQDNSVRCKISYNELTQIGEFIIEETTGTSGFPLRVVKSVSERAKLALNLYRLRKRIDAEFDMSKFRSFNHTTLSQHNPKPYDFTQNHILEIYNEIQRDKIRWLHTSIVPLKKHIKILQQEGITEFPFLKYIELTGNYLEEEDIKLVQAFFGVQVTNLYGCMETWAIAYGTSEYGMDICEDVVNVEIVDDEGEIIEEYGKVGNVIVTSLVCNTMPLIRYDLGDRAKIEMINGHKKLILQEGRNNQYIKGLDRKILGTKQFGNILKMTMQKISVDNIDFIQFIQKEIDLLEIRMNNFEQKELFLSVLLVMIEERLNAKFRYEITLLEENQINAKENEKQELFICKV